MKRFIIFFTQVLELAYQRQKGQLFIGAAAIAAIVGSAITIGTKISADSKAKKEAHRLEQQKNLAFQRERLSIEKGLTVAKDLVKQGDPTLAEKNRLINQNAADTIGKVVSSSGSTQEIINAAQTVQANKDKAKNLALTQAREFKLRAKKFLAERLTLAGQQRLQAIGLINQDAQLALAAISANAQSDVDTAQSISSTGIQIASQFGNN